MRIAQVTAYWGPAYPTGSGVFCYELSKRLARQFEVHVFTSSIGNFTELSKPDNIHLHPLRTYATIWDMNPLADVFTKLIQDDFDIIHVHSYIFFLSNMAALAKLFKPKSKYILHFNGGLDFSGDSRSFHRTRIWAKENIYDRTLGYLTTRLADKLLTASKNDVPIIQRKFGAREVQWIPNAVDTTHFAKAQNEHKTPVVTYVGKLEKWKGIDTLIKSFEVINKQVEDVRFLVVGTGSLEGELRKKDLPIEFAGAVPYDMMPEIYQKTSILVLPSYMEGFPCTCVEALSSEVPVVASDVGDVKDIVLDGKAGFLVRPGDYEAIASYVIKILNDEELAKAMGKTGRAHVTENFDYEAVTAQVSAIYEEILKR